MVLEKLKELEIPFNLEELVVDFEINIHKSIDEILPDVAILGCFFHFAKAFKTKVDKKKMKKHYESNPDFRQFIKRAIGLSSLPLEDLETGIQWLKDNTNFSNETEEDFKNYFIDYIETFWLNGVFPPFIWNTWTRTGDWTNNNQEGFNSKMNKELAQSHPSPGILLCFKKKTNHFSRA